MQSTQENQTIKYEVCYGENKSQRIILLYNNENGLHMDLENALKLFQNNPASLEKIEKIKQNIAEIPKINENLMKNPEINSAKLIKMLDEISKKNVYFKVTHDVNKVELVDGKYQHPKSYALNRQQKHYYILGLFVQYLPNLLNVSFTESDVKEWNSKNLKCEVMEVSEHESIDEHNQDKISERDLDSPVEAQGALLVNEKVVQTNHTVSFVSFVRTQNQGTQEIDEEKVHYMTEEEMQDRKKINRFLRLQEGYAHCKDFNGPRYGR